MKWHAGGVIQKHKQKSRNPVKQSNKQRYKIRVQVNRVQGQAEIMKPKEQSEQGVAQENPKTRQTGVKNRKPKKQIQKINRMSQGQQTEEARTGG